MSMLEDGTYDVVVIDAREDDVNVLHLDLVVSSGAHRGEVVNVAATRLDRPSLALLGRAMTLTIVDGKPRMDA